jgi:hypothetical protein
MNCSIPRCKRRATRHHFPVKKSDGGNITIELCRHHHNLAEVFDEEVIEAILKKAPTYWMEKRVWDTAQGPYYDFVNQWKCRQKKKEQTQYV